MLPGVRSVGNDSNMRGNSDDCSMENSSNDTSGATDESFLPPIDSRWMNEVNDELTFADNDDDANLDYNDRKGIHSRRQMDKKLSKSGRFIANKSSMSDSFVLPNITMNHDRKSRTAGSNWTHGGETARARHGMPVSKSCPILKNRNGYQSGKDTSDDDDDEDLGSDFLSISFNVMSQTEREKNRLARLESTPKSKKANAAKPTNTTTNTTLQLPNIYDRSPRGSKDDNSNGASERRRTRRNAARWKTKTDSEHSSHDMEFELDVAPWGGKEKEATRSRQKGGDVHCDGEAIGNDPSSVSKDKVDTGKSRTKRKAGDNKRPPITAKNPDSKCRDWLHESHQ